MDLAEERRKRADAEAGAAELQKQHTRLQLELELLKQQVGFGSLTEGFLSLPMSRSAMIVKTCCWDLQLLHRLLPCTPQISVFDSVLQTTGCFSMETYCHCC
jgi:hypothetical protein